MNVTIIHQLPGRIRIVVEGMCQQPHLAYRLQLMLQETAGVRYARCNSDTGRVLIYFDQNLTNENQILSHLTSMMSSGSHLPAEETVAATLERDVALSLESEEKPALGSENRYLLPTVASASLLGALSLKRLWLGRSVWATSTATFWMAAGVSIVAGYPILRRGIEQLIQQRKASPDLWMGLATLSMAVVRENLVALSVITAVNMAMYKRYSTQSVPEDSNLPPNVEAHSRRMSRLGLILGPLSFLFSRNPFRALGVMLAASPRPTILAHKYRWAVAQQEAQKRNLLVPSEHGLSSLALVKNVVFDSDSIVYDEAQALKVLPLGENSEVGKVVALAVSLIQGNETPWRDRLVKLSSIEQRSIHTASNVELCSEGVRGFIQGHETLFGTRTYIAHNGIDDTSIVLEERRLERQGYSARILVVDKQPIALFGLKPALDPKWERMVQDLRSAGYQVSALGPFGFPTTDGHALHPLEPISMEDLFEGLNAGNTTLFIGEKAPVDEHAHLIRILPKDAARLPETLQFCCEKSRCSRLDISVTKTWNLLGMCTAVFAPFTAPLIGLSGDVVSMFMIASENWRSRRQAKQLNQRETVASVHHASTTRRENGFHYTDATELLEKFGTSLSGLDQQRVRDGLAQWGSNELVSLKPPSVARIFLNQFREMSMLILIGTAGLSFVLGERFSALCMAGILVLNAAIATWQEKRSNQVIQTLKVEDDLKTTVIRAGQEQTVSTRDLVPGDIVALEPGDRVPADLRILQSWNLEVNEAMLTGESVPATKREGQLAQDTPLADRTNCMFMGTVVTRGRCMALVVSTGSETEIGQLQDMLNVHEDAPTFLQKRVTAISKRFVIGALVAAGIVGIAGLLRGIPPVQLLISCVTLAASAIPEGLPLTITVALTAGVLQMSKRRAVIKKLANLESLGRVTVICSDKTGTLTKNEMTVQEISTIGHRIRVSGDGYVPIGDFYAIQDPDIPLPIADYPDITQLISIGMLCNNACLQGQNGDPTGDPTEAALLTVASKADMNTEAWKRHREIPFDATIRSMSVVCEANEQSSVVCEDETPLKKCAIFTKGALEAVLDKCTHYQLDDQIHPMTDDLRRYIREENFRLSSKALRVLAFAYRYLTDDEDPLQAADSNLVYVGLMGMMDPPKEGVAESIAEARRLMIKPVMITGDHPVTAQAIGADLGIFHPGDRILTGKEIDELSPDELDLLIFDTSIFARVSPEHKLRIVEAFQRVGDVVAMTGDGVNDAPAMRQADVGIAMGIKGTDIAKGTAGVVLMEDHFHAIVEGVKGGRGIIRNIRRAMGCLLSGNLAEVLVTAVSIMIGLPMPLIPLQILLMNILTDAVPAMVLATGSQTDTASKPYQDVIDKELYKTVLARGCVLGLGAVAVFAVALGSGVSLPIARTMTYAALVVGQLMQTAAWRRYGAEEKVSLRRDRILFLSTIGSWLALAATIYLPGLTTVFATVPIGFNHWGVILGVTGGLTAITQLWLHRGAGRRWNLPTLNMVSESVLLQGGLQ